MAIYETAGSVINDTAVELGLEPLASNGAGAHSSTDPNFMLLWRLLKRTGRQLALEFNWRQLRKEHSFTTDGVESEFALPTDFSRMIDQAGWNRTQDRSLLAVGEEVWQYLKAVDSGETLTAIFRPKDSTIELWPQPPAANDTIAFAYMSQKWVSLLGDLSVSSWTYPPSGSHYVHFDTNLLVPALKLAYQRARGFDTSGSQAEFEAAWSAVTSANAQAAPVLSLSGGGVGERLIDAHNAPETGFGS